MGRVLWLGLVAVAACGSSSGSAPPKPTPLANTAPSQNEQSRNDVVKDALAALAAGDVERLMSLADPKGMYEHAFSCKDDRDDGEMAPDAKHLETALRRDFGKAAGNAKGAKIEVVSIRNEMRGSRRSRERDRNATFIAKGGAVSSACVARTDLVFHEVEVRVRISKDGSSKESKTKLDLVHARGRWFVAKVPKDLSSESGASGAVAMMEAFSDRMCGCKDKACADQVNEDMSKWGTDMAKNAGAYDDERPDPELAKKSADIMTRYTECMTKLMMAGTGGTP
ncbi:MAG: hypothetical protein H0V17_25540 [Deltaproteobacteria bacterium]|nr:hypothetical protein [Deltaproteobacteria bacterium]